MQLVNSRTIEADRISLVDILSQDRDIFLYIGDSEDFIIKEYMNRDKAKYCAMISHSDGELKIENGQKPPFGPLKIGFKARLELYIPESYSEKINIKSEDCNVNCDISNAIRDITILAKDGNIDLSLPATYIFNFSALLSDGKLNTPFSDKLSKSTSDKNLVQGIIGDVGNGSPQRNVSLAIYDGAIRVKWGD